MKLKAIVTRERVIVETAEIEFDVSGSEAERVRRDNVPMVPLKDRYGSALAKGAAERQVDMLDWKLKDGSSRGVVDIESYEIVD
jgi:hypothetical protein